MATRALEDGEELRYSCIHIEMKEFISGQLALERLAGSDTFFQPIQLANCT